MPSIAAQQVEIFIPAAYLEDARRALVVEIDRDADALKCEPEERDSNARILRRDLALLDQLAGATADTRVEAPQDGTCSPIIDMLSAMVGLLHKRLERVAHFGPLPMGDVLDIAEQLSWAASAAVRAEPDLEHRLEPNDWALADSWARANSEAVA